MNNSVNIAAAVKDLRCRDHESEIIDANGHRYIYRYMADKGVFIRATVPSGAAKPVFKVLSGEDKVPVGGWISVIEYPSAKLHLVEN